MKRSGAVTASSSAAAEAGVAILRQGGNAVDAAVATALASCVADGCNTGLGGYGGHMVVGPVWGDPVSIDFNMWVPASAADAYRGRGGEVLGVARSGATGALDEPRGSPRRIKPSTAAVSGQCGSMRPLL